MGKRRKSKMVEERMKVEMGSAVIVVQPEPKLFSSTAKECEEGSKILMRNGFYLTLLNIIFGLLPITIQGSTVTYSRISLATFYSTVALVALSFVSFIFVCMTLVVELTRGRGRGEEGGYGPLDPSSDVLALIIDRGAHVLGFLGLMLRGRVMAHRIPAIWCLLSKAIQNCIVNIHGDGDGNITDLSSAKNQKTKKSNSSQHRVRMYKLRRFCRRCVLFYTFALIFNEVQILTESLPGLMADFLTEFQGVLTDNRQIYLVVAGYIMWDFTTLSHVLVSMILSYFVMTLYACLKSVNEELEVILKVTPVPEIPLVTNTEDKKDGCRLGLCGIWKLKMLERTYDRLAYYLNTKRTKSKSKPVPVGNSFSSSSEFDRDISAIQIPMDSGSGSGSGSGAAGSGPRYKMEFSGPSKVQSWKYGEDAEMDIETRLNYVKDCYGAVEDVLVALSATWGISLLIEVQVLVATVLANLFFIFSSFFYRLQGDKERFDETRSQNDGSFGPYADLCIHFFFFYWLAVVATKMHNESRKPLRILKDVPYDKFSSRIQTKLETFKSDIAATSIQLTAADYFVVSKSLMTAVCGSIITFLIVLVQFKNEEVSKEQCVCTLNNTDIGFLNNLEIPLIGIHKY